MAVLAVSAPNMKCVGMSECLGLLCLGDTFLLAHAGMNVLSVLYVITMLVMLRILAFIIF